MAHTNVQLVSGNLTTGGDDPTFFIDRVNNKIGIGDVPDTSGDDSSNVLQVTGSMLATKYHGDGSSLTGLNDSKWLEYSGDTTKIYYNGGNVGIGVTNPQETLDIAGSMRVGVDGMLTISSRSSTYGSETVALQTTIDGRSLSDANPGTHGGESRNVLALQPDGGYVGIGKESPVSKLDVNGTVTATTFSGALSGNATTATTAGTCSGNSATATTATNQSGGTVSATTGTFSGAVSAQQLDVNGVIKSNVPSWFMWDTDTIHSGTLNFSANSVPPQNCTVTLSNGRVTATVAGRYFASFFGHTESNVASGFGCQYYLRKNGISDVKNFHKQPISTFSALGGITLIVDLAVNDYLDVNTNFAVRFADGAGFCGFMIG